VYVYVVLIVMDLMTDLLCMCQGIAVGHLCSFVTNIRTRRKVKVYTENRHFGNKGISAVKNAISSLLCKFMKNEVQLSYKLFR